MRLVIRVLGIALLSVELEAPEEQYEEDTEIEGYERLMAADLSFGFAPDPVFPEFEWEDDEDEGRHQNDE